MMRSLPLSVLFALAACGEADPTPPADNAASAGAINASVAQAQNTAVNAQLDATGAPNTPQARQEAAQNVLGDSNAAGGTGAAGTGAGAGARQGRPTTVNPAAGDPLPAQPQ